MRQPGDRRLGIWRKRGSVYVTLTGESIRQKDIAANACMQDERWLASHGGSLSVPIPPPAGYRNATDWGLPQSVASALARNGISSLYEWQEQCLQRMCESVWGSVIYSAPTSGGKSLVADIVMIRRLLYEGRRAMILCPFVSICKERANFLRSILQPCGIIVEEFHGPVGKPWHPGVDIAVCTVQKGISILHRIVGNEELDDQSEDEERIDPSFNSSSSSSAQCEFSKYIGTVIVDEFHLSCEQRSSVMESFVSRLGLLPDRNDVLLIGMSATLSDESKKAISVWLGGHTKAPCLMYNCDFRPIELSISTKRGRAIAPVMGNAVPRQLNVLFDARTDNDFFASLVHESQVSTIVFCATRNWCENACGLLTRLLGTDQTTTSDNYSLQCQRTEIVEALKLLSPSGVHPILAGSLPHGIAFHHAGLTSEERTIIETGFRTKAINVLCATSTLSAGVNLPAERVILRTLSAASGGQQQNMSVVSVGAKVKQMVGRAGRAGHATKGEAIIMCSNDKEEKLVHDIFSTSKTGSAEERTPLSQPEDPKWIAKEILETISFLGKTRIEFFLREFARSKLAIPAESVRDAIQFLLKNKLVSMVESNATVGGSLMPTVMGDALAHSSLPTDEAETVFRELNAARQKLCLSGDDLHLLFLITPPVSVSETEFEEFTAASDVFMTKEVRAILGTAELDTASRRKRMMVALMLRDLTSGSETVSSISAVAKRYGVQTGTVQYLQSNAATYCAMVSSFCERLQWNSLAAALNSVKPRLHFGVPDELLPLVEIEGISPARARALARAGLTSVKRIAKSKPIDIALVLARSAETSETAQRLLDLTSKMIINNARIKLGWTSLPMSGSSDSGSYGLFPSISPPVLMQLIGTQRQDELDGSSIDPTLVENEAEANEIEETAYEASLAATLSQATDTIDDDFLLSALRLIDTAPPRRRNRRISDLTTVDGRDQRKEFEISSNYTGTMIEESANGPYEDAGLDSLILRSIDFNGF